MGQGKAGSSAPSYKEGAEVEPGFGAMVEMGPGGEGRIWNMSKKHLRYGAGCSVSLLYPIWDLLPHEMSTIISYLWEGG